jgi:hypothetical protein
MTDLTLSGMSRNAKEKENIPNILRFEAWKMFGNRVPTERAREPKPNALPAGKRPGILLTDTLRAVRTFQRALIRCLKHAGHGDGIKMDPTPGKADRENGSRVGSIRPHTGSQ